VEHAILKSSNSVLIVVDVQERLMDAMDSNMRAGVEENLERLALGAKLLKIPVLVTEQYPKGLGPTIPQVAAALGEQTVLEKTDFSCGRVPEFCDALSALQRNHVVLTGAESHICVYQTALDLQAQGYTVHIVTDAVASRQESHRALALEQMSRLGMFTMPTETVLFQWLEKAGSEAFKQISRSIR